MEFLTTVIGKVVLWGILGFGVAGMIGACFDDENGIGAEWQKGIVQIGQIFWTVAGFFTLIPYLTKFAAVAFTKFSALFGADPAVLAGSLIVVDGGGYHLTRELAVSNETWILAFFSSAMLGCVLNFALPIGLTFVKERDKKYFSLGILGGVISTPFGVILGGLLIMLFKPELRSLISVNSANDMTLNMTLPIILQNTMPLAIFCALLAILLKVFPDQMCDGFIVFGKVLNAVLRAAFMIAVIQLYTGVFTDIFGSSWKFAPIIADEVELVRALEVCGMVGMMLCGAYPMIYVLNKYFGKQLNAFGKALKFTSVGSLALIGQFVNEMALFTLFSEMRPRDKVRSLAFANGAAFILADQLTFTLNFQPNLYVPFAIAKIGTGLIALFIVDTLLGRTIERFEQEDRASGVIAQDEYLEECA